MFSERSVSMSKSERTRASLRAIALASFRNRGYDATTIRVIAAEAGVSVGATHYHFPSKSHLVQELYLEVQDAHRAAATPLLAAAGKDLATRVGIAMRTGIAGLAPYREHAQEFLAAVFAPRSPVHPFAEDSAAALSIVEGVFRDAVDGASGVPDDLRKVLPRALVLAYLLLALYWVYDSSPDQARSAQVLDRSLSLLRVALRGMRLPLVRRPLIELLAVVGEVAE